MHAPFALWIIDVLKPRILVELGTFSGTSYCAFCEAVKALQIATQCFAVDTWLGDAQSLFYGEEILNNLKEHHDPLYSDFSRLIRKDFDSALGEFQDRTIDLLHIDGLHTYEAVKHDFETWLPRVSDRGVVLFHDTQVRGRDFGVWRFWDEIRQQYPHAELLHGHGLGILIVGPNAPNEIKEIISSVSNSNEAMQTFRDFFEHLGSACLLQVKLQSASEAIRQGEANLERLSESTESLRHEIRQTSQAWELRGAEIDRLNKVQSELEHEVSRYRETARESFIMLGDRAKSLTHRFQMASIKTAKLPPARAILRGASSAFRGARSIYSSVKTSLAVKARRELIQRSRLFDPQFYLKENPSVVASGMDPLDHFIRHGGYEGLKCSRLFDSSFYLARYPDIRAAGLHPLIHYIKNGKREGRYTTPEFAPDLYLDTKGFTAPKVSIPDITRERVSIASLFIVYGKAHLDFINNVLIPTLKSQASERPIELHLVNYANNTALFENKRISENLCIYDWSSDRQNQHIGFGEGHNFLFSKANPRDCFVIVNPDSCPYPGCLDELFSTYERTSAGIVEARQWPKAHPKEFNPETGETPWASGAFSLIDSETFSSISGFDPVYFLYGEDVDLSWRVWLAGKKVITAPNAICGHFTGLFSYREDRFYYEHFYSTRNFIVLARKFFGEIGERYAIRMLKNSGFPDDFKCEILESYEGIKNDVKILAHIKHPMIKILGMNIYHESQPLDLKQVNVVNDSESTMEMAANAG
jgi:hypothetical protein